MRENPSKGTEIQSIKAVLMMEYHQSYSEIKKIPIDDLLFFVEYHNAKVKYEKYLMNKNKNNMKNKTAGRKLSFRKKPSMRSF